MTDLEKGEFADRLRRTLHAKAELTPRVVGRRPPEHRWHIGWMPLTAIGVVAVGVAATVVVTTRSNDQAKVTPSAASSVDTTPASTGVLLSPPPDTPGLRLGTGSNIEPWPGGGYTTGVVSSPSGLVVIIQNDPGSFPPGVPDPIAESRQVGELTVLTLRGIGDLRTYALESPCSNTSIAAITTEPAWTGEPQTLLEAITIDPNGSMYIQLPEGWTSYGAGRLGPGYRYEFTVPIDGTPTAFTVFQRFDTDVGATVRHHDATPITFDDAPALIYEEGQLVLTFAAGPDAVSLAGPVDTETLLDIAESLDRRDVTVDLDAYRDRYPTVEADTCDRSISITP